MTHTANVANDTGSLYLAMAPNIMRKTISDLAQLAPELLNLGNPTHAEMLAFSNTYATTNDIPDLTVCAYPQYVKNVLRAGGEGKLERMPEDLPPMRKELAALGMTEPCPYLRVICFIPFIISVNRHVTPPITDWKDLCREDICRRVAIPPIDTPLPDFFAAMMTATFGDLAKEVIAHADTRFTPLDINKEIDAGNFAAGVSIPAFSRTFRDNNGQMVWPASGAWAVPLSVSLRRNPHPQALEVMRYLLSEEYQSFMSTTGNLIPVIDDVPWPSDMVERNGHLQWPGWESLLALGDPR